MLQEQLSLLLMFYSVVGKLWASEITLSRQM